jgi:amidohydrolase
MREDIHGSVKFLFQPAEEVNLGAKKMVSLGCLEDPHVDALFGMHNCPEIPLGTVAVKNGPLMAGVDRINLTIHGRGGHGGIPQRNADPIVAAAAIIQSLQTVVSRNLSPVDSGVISVCNVQAGHGTVNNVCPDEVKMYGTVRTYRQSTKGLMDKRIHELVEGIAAAYNTVGEVEYIYELPVTDNTRRPGWPDLFSIATAAVTGVGATPVDPEPSGGGEDFSVYSEGFDGRSGVPTFFYWLGVRNEETGCVHSWHSPKFKADAACIPIGAGVYALSALEAMAAMSDPS